MRRYLQRSVSRKLAFAVSVTLAALSLVFLYALVQADRGGREQLHRSFRDLVSDTALASLAAGAESGHADAFKIFAEALDDREPVTQVRVLDVDGMVRWSSMEGESGLTRETSELEALTNEQRCQGCHEASVSTLGYLDIELEGTAIDAVVLRFQRLLAVLAVLPIIVTVLVLLVLMRRMVGQPLRSLAATMKEAEKNNLVRAQIRTSDEFGELAEAFNQMLSRMTALDASKLDAVRELEAVQDELQETTELAQATQVIEETNRELEARLQELSILYDVSRDIASQRSLDDLYRALAGVVGEELGYREFAILLLDAEAQTLTVHATHGFADEDREKIEGMTFRVGQGVSGEVAGTGKPILIEDTRKDSRYLHYKGKKLDDGTFLSLPLKVSERVVGVMNFLRPQLEGFSREEIRFLQAVADVVAIAIDNVQLYQRLTALSSTDELTGLPNRRTFSERITHEIKRANRFDRRVALLMVDIDYFKNYNDTHGHLDGDALLKKFANVLHSGIREVDHVARYGGEEFVVVLPNADHHEAFSVADKLRRKVERTRFKNAQTQPNGRLTISIGVAVYPDHAENPEELLLRADFALYHAKENGRNRTVVFDHKLQAALERARS